MTDLFLDVLNTSFSATWVVLAVVLARLLLKKAPRWMICGLWILVAARLLIGSGIPAPFSMIPSSELIPPESLYAQAPAIHSGVSILDNAINPVYTESLRPVPGASINPLQVWTAVFANLWVLGAAVMALWAMFSCYRVRRQVRESIHDDGVYLCDRIASPFIFGLFRPKIYLPSDLSTEARPHVIAHEQAHLRRLDHWWKPMGFALLTVNWFNPAMWLAYALLCRDIELACDEKVVRHLSAVEKKSYSAALLFCSVNSRKITACPLAFGEVGVKQRIKSVLNYKKPAFWVIVTAVVLTVVLAVGLLTSPENVTEARWYLLTLHQNGVYGNENLTGSAADTLAEILDDLSQEQMTPGPNLEREEYAEDFDVLITLDSGAIDISYELFRTTQYGWVCLVRDMDSGNRDWLFDGSALDSFMMPYEAELRLAEACFLRSNDAALSLEFHTVTNEGIHLRAAIPCLNEGECHIHWEYEAMEDAVGFRCRPIGRKDWMEVRFYEQMEHLYHYATTEEPILLKNGASGTLYHSGTPDIWNEIVLNTTRGILRIYAPNTSIQITDWKKDDYSMAISILETLSISENGASMYGNANPLDLTLYLENITPDGATLVCTQDGTRWSDVITGSNWSLERLENNEWVSLLPEDMVWTTEAYPIPTGESRSFAINWGHMIGSLEPGQYQLGKTFSFYEQITLNQSATEPVTETRYVLFEINPLGISLRLENLTPGGATLVCKQDGTPWERIITGSDWTLEQLTADGWVSILPEDIGWDAITIGVNQDGTTEWNLDWSMVVGDLEPGGYRVGKTFTAYPHPDDDKSTTEGITQTCYAVFVNDYLDLSTLKKLIFSPELSQAIRDDWSAYDAMSEFDRQASSKTPGTCAREFDDWASIEDFIGMEIANPLEELVSLEKGNWAAAPEGFNGAARFRLSWSGTREGYVQEVQIVSGYRRDELRVNLRAEIYADPGLATSYAQKGSVTTEADSGEGYEARTETLTCNGINYIIRVMGDPRTGDQLQALLEELLPYFENPPTA